MELLPLWARVALGAALVGFIGWRVLQQWRAAGQQSDAIFARQAAMRAVHAHLLDDPAWQRIWHALVAQGYPVAVNGGQPGAYSFGLITQWGGTDSAQSVVAPGASHMNVYLRGPKKIVACLTYATGEVQIRECAFGEWPAEAF